MVDLLKRSLAPITAAAWTEIDATATRILKSLLSARTLVDFRGPHGWEYAAVNIGRLEIARKGAAGDVPWGLRSVLPLLEVRVPFSLRQMELDNISRGCRNPDLGALEETARRVALFEETAIYKGFSAGQIKGIIEASAHKPLKLPPGIAQYPQAVSAAIRVLRSAGVDGPYALVLASEPYDALMGAEARGYPPRRILRDLLGGEILWSPALEGGVLLSARGGDFELTVGQDLAIGYATHDRDQVELYLTETFTFRVLNPAAAVELRVTTGR